MTHQIIISDVQNTTLCIPLESAKTLSQLHESIYRLSGIEPLLHRLLFNGFPLSESIYLEAIGNSSDFLNLKFVLSGGCNGGKGGFGSLLRNAKSSKKTTNFGSCRDLNGRKLRDVQYEKKLLEWKEKENNKKKEVEPLLSEKIKKNLSKNNKKEEENWQAETKNISLRVSESIEKGLAKQKQSDELKRKRDEAPIKLFGLMEDSISESDLSEEEEEEFEKKSKRHCSAGIKSTTTPTTTPTPSGLKSTTTLTTIATIATIATVDTAIAAVTTATTSTTIEASDSLSNLN